MTVLEQIRIENPSLALLPDDLLIEKLLLEYKGDLDPDTFRQSLLAEQPVVSPVTSPVAGGKRAFTPTQTPSDIGFTQSFVGPTKSSWQRSWGPAVTRLRGGIAGLMGNDERAQELYNDGKVLDPRNHSLSSTLINYWKNEGLGLWQDKVGTAHVATNRMTETMLITAGADSGTTWLATNAINTLLYGTLLESYVYMKGEPDLMVQYEKRYLEAISKLKNLGEGDNTVDIYRDDAVRVERM